MHAIVTPAAAVVLKRKPFQSKGKTRAAVTTEHKKLFANSLLLFLSVAKDPDFYGDLKLSKLHANLNYRLDVCTRTRCCTSIFVRLCHFQFAYEK